MNTIKKRLDKLPKNKVYKICQKMKVKCQTKDNKKKMILRILRPLLNKYRMKSSDIDFSVLKIGGNEYINKHLNNLKGTPQITIGLPLRDLPRLFEEEYMSKHADCLCDGTHTQHTHTIHTNETKTHDIVLLMR